MHDVDKRSKPQINNDIYATSICVSTANFAEYIIKPQIIKVLCTSFIWIFLFFASKSALNSQIISSAYALFICRAFCHCRHGTVRSSIYDFNSTFPHYESTNKLFFIDLNSTFPHYESLNKPFFIDLNSASPQHESTSKPLKSPTNIWNAQFLVKQHIGSSITAQTCIAFLQLFYSLFA